MENLRFASIGRYRVHLSQSRVIVLLCASPLLLLMLGVIPHWGALMPTLRHTLSRLFGGRSSSAFFLLNALILTIIGSSKLEGARGKLMGGQDIEGSNVLIRAEAVGQLQGKNDEENVAARTVLTVGHSYDICPSVLTTGHGDDAHVKVHRRSLLVRSRSLSASEDHLSEKGSTQHAEVVTAVVNHQHKAFDSTRPRLARNCTSRREEARIPIAVNPPRHGLEENKLAGDSLSNVHAVGEGSHAIEPALKKPPLIHANKARRARRGNNSPAPTLPAQPVPAAAAHSSFEDVWAGIMAANAANQHMRAANPCDDEGSASRNVTHVPPVAPPVPSPRPATEVPPPSPTAAGNGPKEVAHSAVIALAKSAAPATKMADVVPKKKNSIAHDHERDSELEELNQRAEEFIARFNQQIHVQRQESLQRRKHSRSCNRYIQHTDNHVQYPSPGLLVG